VAKKKTKKKSARRDPLAQTEQVDYTPEADAAAAEAEQTVDAFVERYALSVERAGYLDFGLLPAKLHDRHAAIVKRMELLVRDMRAAAEVINREAERRARRRAELEAELARIDKLDD